ncbi:MAG: glycosyltransferase family 9 protein [Desulfobacteraceae bacterium]|nr:MAG: glycosyltransferase family 9 protein [Desulfobacteraceae bacterium]
MSNGYIPVLHHSNCKELFIHIKLKRGMQNKTPYRFLVIRWSGMGDVVMTLPALKWLKDRFKGSYICYLTDCAFAGIPARSGLVQRVETIDRRGFKSNRRLLPAALQAMRVVAKLRRSRFHGVFDLQGFGETSLIAYFTGAPFRVGRVKGSPLRRRVYTAPIQADWEKEHRSDYFLNAVVGAFGYPAGQAAVPYRLPLLRTVGCCDRIGINIGASTESRRWSEENFFDLAQRLSRRGYGIRFFLGPQEAFLESAVKDRCAAQRWEFLLHRKVDSLIDALADCRLLVSNDTGPGHLAAAIGIPVVTLFSTGSPENVRPLAPRGKWLRNRTDINRIGVPEVEAACLQLLEGA